MRKFFDKLFGGLKMSWPAVIIFAIIAGIYTAIMAMYVPDGNSFHDISVYPECWLLFALIIALNSKKPLEASFKVFVFFLISQPLVYLIQVPFNALGWQIFSFYRYWFIATLLTFPAAYIAWYVKKDKWYSALILSVATALLAYRGMNYLSMTIESFPNHLLSTIFTFALIPFLIFGILKNKQPRLIASGVSLAAIVVMALIRFAVFSPNQYETYNNSFIGENNIILVGEPHIVQPANNGSVTIIPYDDTYNFKLNGVKGQKYYFTIFDDIAEYQFEYYYDEARNTVIVELVE